MSTHTEERFTAGRIEYLRTIFNEEYALSSGGVATGAASCLFEALTEIERLSAQLDEFKKESDRQSGKHPFQIIQELFELRAQLATSQTTSEFEPCKPGHPYELRRVKKAYFRNPTLIINHSGQVAAFFSMTEAAHFVEVAQKLFDTERELATAREELKAFDGALYAALLGIAFHENECGECRRLLMKIDKFRLNHSLIPTPETPKGL